VYDDESIGTTWHDADTTHQLATLHLLNKVCAGAWPPPPRAAPSLTHACSQARIPYFDRVLRQQLNLPAGTSAAGRPGSYLEIGCGGGIATVREGV